MKKNVLYLHLNYLLFSFSLIFCFMLISSKSESEDTCLLDRETFFYETLDHKKKPKKNKPEITTLKKTLIDEFKKLLSNPLGVDFHPYYHKIILPLSTCTLWYYKQKSQVPRIKNLIIPIFNFEKETVRQTTITFSENFNKKLSLLISNYNHNTESSNESETESSSDSSNNSPSEDKDTQHTSGNDDTCFFCKINANIKLLSKQTKQENTLILKEFETSVSDFLTKSLSENSSELKIVKGRGE